MVTIQVQNNTTSIPLGRRGENEATKVIFDFAPLEEVYGEGTPQLFVKRPVDTNSYVVDLDGNEWVVSNIDTAYEGHGACEIFWYVGDTLAKTIVYSTYVAKDIGDAGETPVPPPTPSYESAYCIGQIGYPLDAEKLTEAWESHKPIYGYEQTPYGDMVFYLINYSESSGIVWVKFANINCLGDGAPMFYIASWVSDEREWGSETVDQFGWIRQTLYLVAEE